MKKILLTLLALVATFVGAQADDLVSGQQYRIVTLDGTKALSCGADAKNNVTLTLTALNDTEGGQVWTFTKNGDYWGITSLLGSFNIDNPSSNHAGFNNQLCLWQTNGGDNQKWNFVDAGDDTYYMVPLENANKCYAEDADGKFTFQDKGADTRVKVVKKEVTIDGITSGKYYRICSPDGTLALSNNGSTANDLVVSMTATNQSDEGQIWQISRKGNYWQIKSYCGNVCLDNPSEAHAKFNNQLIQWKTSGGDNQKWVFEVVDDDYYMIPFQNATAADKCYGYNEDGVFIYQDKGGENTKLRLVEAIPPTCPIAHVNGYYALQAISTYPTYNYVSEGRFWAFADNGTASLTKDYTYAHSRLYVTTDDEGHVTISLPQADNKVIAAEGTTLKATTNAADAAQFTLFMNTDELTLDTRVAVHVGENTAVPVSSDVKLVSADAAGTGLTTGVSALNNSFSFRLVALPAADDVDALKAAIDEAKGIKGLSGDNATALAAAITQAQSELDYPYLTQQDVVLDVADLQSAIDAAKAALAGGSKGLKNNITAIDEAQSAAIRVEASNHHITVYNANNVRIFNAAGQRQQNGVSLPSGAYIVKADGKVIKVVL